MKIKKYVGINTQEAMNKVKAELGPEAIILNTRVIKQKGIFSFFKKPLIEITAAVDEKHFNDVKPGNVKDMDNINNELKRLRSIVEEVAMNISNDENKLIDDDIAIYRDNLVDNGIEYDIATSIIKEIDDKMDLQNKTEEEIRQIICYNVREHLRNVEPLDSTKTPNTIFFIGPTGVGKTTTLAKMAAQLVIQGRNNIGLITADTYRIAAVDQLRTYSEILKLPLKVVYKPEDMYKAMAELYDKDIILVDTAGRSHKDQGLIGETRDLIDSVKNKEVYLVLSMTTDSLTINSIINQYSFIDDLKVIFTKLDEAESYGNIFNTIYKHRCTLSYLTNGQDVPDDIKIANTLEIAQHLIGESYNGRSS